MTSQHSLFNSIISTPPIFIAEIGGNHNGNVVLGQKMIDAAISSGAQIIKFQTYTMSDFVAKSHISYNVFAQENLTYEELHRLQIIVNKRMLYSSQHLLTKKVQISWTISGYPHSK